MKGLAIASLTIVLLVAVATATYQHYSVRPLPAAKPSPRQQVSPSQQLRAVIAADTATPTPSPQLPLDQALVSFPKPTNDINAIIPAPGEPQALVLTGNGEDDSYSLKINLVDLRTKVPRVTEIVSGSNAEDFTTPVWSADSKQIYYEFDNGCYFGRGSCGIHEFDLATGRSGWLIDRPTVGLAISPDNQFLAFWDYTLGDVLTVYSIPKKQVFRRWEGQAHTAGEFFLKEMVFAPDGKSLLAVTSEAKRWPLKEFNLESGDVRSVSEHTPGGPVVTSQGVYFVEADEYKQDADAHNRLMRLVQTGAQPELVLSNFPYPSIQPAGSPGWIATWGSRGRMLLYDTQARSTRRVGPDCWQAAVLSDGRAVYGLHGSLVEDANLCGTPAAATPAF